MIIHRIRIPLQDIINRAIIGAKRVNDKFDFEVDCIKIDEVSRHLVLDIKQVDIRPKDVSSQKQA